MANAKKCDICGKELTVVECYDEDGYSQFVNLDVRDSRLHGAEYDICNECYEKILKFAKGMKYDKG